VIYEWDPEKAKSNLNQQGIYFEEAVTVFRIRLLKHILTPITRKKSLGESPLAR